jgi:ferritin-like metal-binding protein YciE
MMPHGVALRKMAAEVELEEITRQFENHWSANRSRMVDEIVSLDINRPVSSRKRSHGRMML